MTARYLQGFVNFRPEDAAKADEVPLGDLVVRIDHADGSVTISYLQDSPVQHGQIPWGRPMEPLKTVFQEQLEIQNRASHRSTAQ